MEKNLASMIAIALLKPEERDLLDESDFDEFKSVVADIKSKPVATIRTILLNERGWEWDGKERIQVALVEMLRCECICERAYREFGKKFEAVAAAYAYLRHFRIMSNWKHEPDSEVMIKVRKCRALLLETLKPEGT